MTEEEALKQYTEKIQPIRDAYKAMSESERLNARMTCLMDLESVLNKFGAYWEGCLDSAPLAVSLFDSSIITNWLNATEQSRHRRAIVLAAVLARFIEMELAGGIEGLVR